MRYNIKAQGVLYYKQKSLTPSKYLIDFDGAVDFADEPVAGGETNSSTEQENVNGHYEGITKIDDCRGQTLKRKLGAIIVPGINEEVDGGEARCEETKQVVIDN